MDVIHLCTRRKKIRWNFIPLKPTFKPLPFHISLVFASVIVIIIIIIIQTFELISSFSSRLLKNITRHPTLEK